MVTRSARAADVDEFELLLNLHPPAFKLGLDSLYKFSSVPNDDSRLEHLFVKGKLYLSLPSSLNDPYECKPHFRWPENASGVKKLRAYLFKISRQNGHTKKESQKVISRAMQHPAQVQELIENAAYETYGKTRIGCFTKSSC